MVTTVLDLTPIALTREQFHAICDKSTAQVNLRKS
jgi:hypothetical protein